MRNPRNIVVAIDGHFFENRIKIAGGIILIDIGIKNTAGTSSLV